MPTKTPKRYSDGFIGVSGGVDSGQNPTVATSFNPEGLSRNKLVFATNATVRGGRIRPRPGFKKTETDEFDGNDGVFQCAEFFKPDNDVGCLIASISGRIWRFNVGTDFSVQEIAIPSDPNPTNRPRVWMYQAESYFIVQDGQSRPFIYDGGSPRRAGPKEVPVGTVGTYGLGRIWQALPNQTQFVAGDLVYSVNGERSDVLGFTENTFLNEGGAFSVPSNAGQIQAMRFPMNLDTSLGQGPLQVFTPNAIFSVNAPLDRDLWKAVTYPIQTISMVNYGALSQNSTIAVNGDLFYRSLDGVRSFVIARREFGAWGNTPISREMERIIVFDDRNLLTNSSAVLFDNRMLMTCSPFRTDNGIAHRGLMPLDFDLISSLSDKRPPAWEGVWTGLNILQVVKGTFDNVERCFAFVSNSGEIEVWEITYNDRFDLLDGEDKPIVWSYETGSYSFNNPFDLKRLHSGDLWIDKLAGQVQFKLQYRPDQHPCWLDWESWDNCATYKDCDTGACETPKAYLEQYRPKKKFSRPPETCNPILNKPFADLYECQARVEITGYCEVKQMRIHAMERDEPEFDKCE